ncbi:hypothetical protein SDC9_55028 [bioreactor metagenome]|uniref:Uncharacterized protein n=1 Tax=bioreactor metagenome TaxID=1076179 RepID=A0A644X3K5_9ZZZZ
MEFTDYFSDFFPDENPDHITRKLSSEIVAVILHRLTQLNKHEAVSRISENDFTQLIVFIFCDRYYVYLHDGYKMLTFVVYWETAIFTGLKDLSSHISNTYSWDESKIPAEATIEAHRRLRIICGMIAAEKLLKNGGRLIYGADPSLPIDIVGEDCLSIDEKDDAMSISRSEYETVVSKNK